MPGETCILPFRQKNLHVRSNITSRGIRVPVACDKMETMVGKAFQDGHPVQTPSDQKCGLRSVELVQHQAHHGYKNALTSTIHHVPGRHHMCVHADARCITTCHLLAGRRPRLLRLRCRTFAYATTTHTVPEISASRLPRILKLGVTKFARRHVRDTLVGAARFTDPTMPRPSFGYCAHK